MRFETKTLPPTQDAIAPDGSDVRSLLTLDQGSLAHYTLAPGATSRAVSHHTVEEIWFFLKGRGEMWRKLHDQESVVVVKSGVAVTIPAGCQFQFRTLGDTPLSAIGITMPSWPGEGEATIVQGIWSPSK